MRLITAAPGKSRNQVWYNARTRSGMVPAAGCLTKWRHTDDDDTSASARRPDARNRGQALRTMRRPDVGIGSANVNRVDGLPRRENHCGGGEAIRVGSAAAGYS